MNKTNDDNDTLLVGTEKEIMLICETTIIPYFADIMWTSVPGSRTIDNCTQLGKLAFTCSSKLYFTPSFNLNGTNIECFLTDLGGQRYSITQAVLLNIGGTYKTVSKSFVYC